MTNYQIDTFIKQSNGLRNNHEYRAHSAPLFEQLKVLDIFKVNTFHTAKFMFLYHHRLLPVSLSNLFVTNNQVHSIF